MGTYKDSEYKKKHYEVNKEKYIAKAKAWKAANPDKIKESSARRYAKKKDHILAKTKEWQATQTPEANRARAKKWRDANPGHAAFSCASRRNRINRQTPPWVKDEELKGYYLMAARLTECTGIKHHVDHIYPIKGVGSSGLHVPWNLQVIPAHINHKKHNKQPEEFYNGFRL